MAKLKKNKIIQLNPKIKMVFGTSAKHEGYLVLSSALDFRNLKLPKGWIIDAENRLTDKHSTSGPHASYSVFIKNVLVAGPKVNIDKKKEKATFYRP